MPVRFNQKELAAIAKKPSAEFDHEGILYLKEKEGNFFNKSESYSEKLFRLKGNLLFYFKSKDKNSDLAGVVILERFKVEPDPTEKDFGFFLDFDEEDEQRYELAAKTGDEMTKWIEFLEMASYEKLRFKLVELRSEIMAITGEDPLPDRHPVVEQNPAPSCRVSLYSPMPADKDDPLVMLPVLELRVRCSDLKSPCEGAKPSGFIKVYGMTPPDSRWTKISQTEVAEEGINPDFLKTIVLHGDVKDVTRLKFVVFDVRNRSKEDVLFLGQAVCTVKDIDSACESQYTLTLVNVDSSGSVGKVHLYGWKRGKSGTQVLRNLSNEFHMGEKDSTVALDESRVRTYLANVIERNFCFPTSYGKDLKVQEFMGESLLSFRIPAQLLGLFIKEEKDAVVELLNLGNLHREWEHLKDQLQNSHFNLVRLYSNSLAEISQITGRNFKKSAEKQEQDLEFISTNLHLQRTRVVEASGEVFIYDIVTVGAPTAYPHKYRHGGLKRMLASAAETSRRMTLSPGDSEKTKAGTKVRHMKIALRKLQKAIKEIVDAMLSTQLDKDELEDTARELSNKVGELLNIQDSSFMADIETSLMRARVVGPFQTNRTSDSSHHGAEKAQLDNCQWHWNGSEFRRSMEVVREMDCGVRGTLVKLMGAVHDVMNSAEYEQKEPSKILSDNAEALITSCQSLVRKLMVSMRFILMQKEASASSTLKEIRYRRDVVFSQALTPILAGFLIKLSQNIHNQMFLEQIGKSGVLVYLESLLTPHGDEMGMLEDTVVALKDMQRVSFKLVPSDSDESFPVVSGSRIEIIVEIPIPPTIFAGLPLSLQTTPIAIVPVLFTIGINEQATLAERFGDMSLQEEINTTNFTALRNYYLELDQNIPDYSYESRQAASLPVLLTHLHLLIQTKKSKNYEILLVAEEICWRLNGIRITSCKSAKDRSSMAVTLEVGRLLKREHSMCDEVFHQVLATLRSQGTRLRNVDKNIGFPKYAFNMMQVKALPLDYRPSEGTYGKNIQT